MRNFLLATCALSSFTLGASQSPASEADDVFNYMYVAKQRLESTMKDSGSAQYRDVLARKVEGSSAWIFCGLVNSKNSFGGYTGFQHFVAGISANVLEEQTPSFSTIWNEFCVGPVGVVLTACRVDQ